MLLVVVGYWVAVLIGAASVESPEPDADASDLDEGGIARQPRV